MFFYQQCLWNILGDRDFKNVIKIRVCRYSLRNRMPVYIITLVYQEVRVCKESSQHIQASRISIFRT